MLNLIEELNKTNHILERFSHLCSHQLKEPLRTIASFAQIAKTLSSNEKLNNYLEIINENCYLLRNIVDGLLRDADNPKKQIMSRSSKVYPSEIIQEIRSLLTSKIEETKAIFVLEKLQPIYIQRDHLFFIFQNLIENALKFSYKDTPSIYIGEKKKEEEIIFYVKDDGIGIDPIFHQKIFQAFNKTCDKSKYKGVGIGLSSCKELIEQYGGNIWVKSALNCGSTFYFSFPNCQ